MTVTVPEAARLLGVSRMSAYTAVRIGEIPSIRIGRRVLVPRAALDRLLGVAGGGDRPIGTNSEAI
jgi:excisionase family DNA binding protein